MTHDIKDTFPALGLTIDDWLAILNAIASAPSWRRDEFGEPIEDQSRSLPA